MNDVAETAPDISISTRQLVTAAHHPGERIRAVDAEHVERPVREVDDARDAEDERQAGRDEEERRRAGEAVQELNDEAREVHRRPSSSGDQSCARIFFTSSAPGRYFAPSR